MNLKLSPLTLSSSESRSSLAITFITTQPFQRFESMTGRCLTITVAVVRMTFCPREAQSIVYSDINQLHGGAGMPLVDAYPSGYDPRLSVSAALPRSTAPQREPFRTQTASAIGHRLIAYQTKQAKEKRSHILDICSLHVHPGPERHARTGPVRRYDSN
ncbi:hypothetical protein EV356DRAFT_95067 [Viridothelium virens]|uniref:Uncharacterized protein n=1 Tax=Viridothelium virens TaxID=1048519 RepID=A0A6A6HCZ0_VIRVR|nr:hypothetical protein EV356DRAFT_95067 [Viridothelium virens]